jgi:predicted AAA+ superfamily ATPase
MSGGIVTICVGRRKTGKTTFSKRLLDKRQKNFPVFIYDINNEYKDYYKEPFVDFDVFLSKIVELRHSYILIEEATIFFNTRGTEQEIINLLVRARHTGNIIQLNFHSFSSVPKYIKNLVDYVVIFKTNDNINDVKARIDDEKILKQWERIKESSNKFEYKVCSMG